MPIFQVTPNELKPLSPTTFGAHGIMERRDLQRLLREQISVLDEVLGERLLVVAEEFGDWIDSLRRIDLLCIDSDANLVVVELKRSDDGGHMELQALRYAAMISKMTFMQLVDTYARYKNAAQPDVDTARSSIIEFLGWDEVDETQFAQDTRIILAAADFGKELTTTVMWLREQHDIDIRCIRMKPYKMLDGAVLLDFQQLIPLPETASFQTQIGVKKQAERQNRSERHDLRLKFWEALLGLAKTKTDLHANRKPTIDNWISGGIGRAGFSLIYTIRQYDSQVELWISLGAGQSAKNKSAFKALENEKADIEAAFGAPLEWQELPEGEGCRIRATVDGGYRSPSEQWTEIHGELVNFMMKLDKVFRARVAKLVF